MYFVNLSEFLLLDMKWTWFMPLHPWSVTHSSVKDMIWCNTSIEKKKSEIRPPTNTSVNWNYTIAVCISLDVYGMLLLETTSLFGGAEEAPSSLSLSLSKEYPDKKVEQMREGGVDARWYGAQRNFISCLVRRK